MSTARGAHAKLGTEISTGGEVIDTLDGRGKGGGELEASEGSEDRDELHVG